MGVEVYTVPPIPGVKLTKVQAGYVAKGPFGCNNCLWFKDGQCPVVGGTVNKRGCCDYWNEKDAPKGVGKKGSEYVYVPGSNYTCSECKFFNASTNTCSPVTGAISPSGSCNKWMPMNLKEEFDLTNAIREGLDGALKESTPQIGKQGGTTTNPGDCINCGAPFNAHSNPPRSGGHYYEAMPDLSPHASGGSNLSSLHHAPGALTESALDRLTEAIYPARSSKVSEDDGDDDDTASAYNAHSLAAHRSSVSAFMGRGGDAAAMHKVAAAHHRLAADSAAKGAKRHGANSQNNKDYHAAQDYHKSQAQAHEAMANTVKRGNSQPNSYEY